MTRGVSTEIRPFGDRALLVELGSVALAHRVAAAVEAATGEAALSTADAEGPAPARWIVGAMIGFGSVVVHLDHPLADEGTPGRDGLVQWISSVVEEARRGRLTVPPGRLVDIPVHFDGPDLDEVASETGTSAAEVVALLTGADLDVAFVGFSPGFAYLTGLAAPLDAVRRRATPRPSVPAGSVALAGGFASIYPQSTPGGWRLVGTSSRRLFDAERPPFSLLHAVDRVRFSFAQSRAADGVLTPPATEARLRPPLTAVGDRWIEVRRPGMLSLVQDAGRHGDAIGVPGAGPSDREALILANRLAGNHDLDAAVECTAFGPSFRFSGNGHVAVVGPTGTEADIDVDIDGRPCPAGTLVPVDAGQTLSLGRVRTGLRAYLAVSGGLRTPELFGSRSTDQLSGLGPGALQAGDRLALGPPGQPRGRLTGPRPTVLGQDPSVLRVLAGPHRLPPPAWDRLVSAGWTVDAASNRIGLRLRSDGDQLPAGEGTIDSIGLVTGAIQVPPDGRPIILGPDHATVGGYPVIGCVISADLSALGQLAPGNVIGFTEVDTHLARLAWEQRERALDRQVSGWFPTATGP